MFQVLSNGCPLTLAVTLTVYCVLCLKGCLAIRQIVCRLSPNMATAGLSGADSQPSTSLFAGSVMTILPSLTFSCGAKVNVTGWPTPPFGAPSGIGQGPSFPAQLGTKLVSLSAG